MLSRRLRGMEQRTIYLSLLFLFLVVGVELWVFSLEHKNRVKAFRIHILVVFQTLIFLAVRYIWKRVTYLLLSKELLSFSTLIKVVLFIILGLALSTFVIVVFWSLQPDPRFVAIVSSTCLGLVVMLTTAMLLVDLISFPLRRLFFQNLSRDPKNKTEMKIRMLLSLIGAFVLIYAGSIGASTLKVEKIEIPVKGLDPRLKGTTIVHLSDLHLGPFNGRTALKNLLAEVNKLDANVVVITGDLVDSTVAAMQEIVKPLTSIKSRHGVYYCTGEYRMVIALSWL